MWRNLLSCALLAEAAFIAWKYRREQERLLATVGYFVLAAALTALSVAEIASELAGTDPHLLSRELTRRLGMEVVRSCEEAMPAGIQRAVAFSILSSILLSAAMVSSIVSGGAAALVASLSYAGVNAVGSILNVSLFSLQLFRFVGQIYIAVADLGDLLYPLLIAVGGVLLVPRVTRRFGATLIALGVGFGLLIPLALNSVAIAAKPKPAEGVAGEVGVAKFEVELTVPVASLGAQLSFGELSVKAPPGFVVVYRNPRGRVVARPAGIPHVEYVGHYEVSGLYYSGVSLPFDSTTFYVEVYNFLAEASAEGIEGGTLRRDSLCSPSRSCTVVRIRVGKGVVAFSDTTRSNTTPPKGWGLWVGRGFFLYGGSEEYGWPLPWYPTGGYLLNHKVVGVADPRVGLVSTLRSNVTLGDPLFDEGGGSAYILNVTVTNVTIWIEGDVDASGICRGGKPVLLDVGESEITVNGSKLKVKPVFSCRVERKYPTFPDSRAEAGRWFDQYARVLNASLPASTAKPEANRCLYGDQSGIGAFLWNKRLFVSQSLWPRTNVTLVIVNVTYFGNITRPAIIGPATAGSAATAFTAPLHLVGGVGACEPRLLITNFTVLDETTFSGLLYDSLLEEVIQPSYVNMVKEEAYDIVNGVALLALIASALAVSLMGVGALSWALGGVLMGGAAPQIPLGKALHILEDLGGAVLGFVEPLAGARRRRSLLRTAAGSRIYEIHDIRKKLEGSVRVLEELRRAAAGIAPTLRGRIAQAGITALKFAWRHRRSHPLSFTLYATGELLRRAAFKGVNPALRGKERLFAALLHPVSSRLLVASDVLYAVAWALDAKPFKAALALRSLRRTLREAKHASRSPARLYLDRRDREGVRLLRAYSDKVAKAVLQGREPKPGDVQGFFRAVTAANPPRPVLHLVRPLVSGKLEAGELAWRVALSTCAMGYAGALTLKLLSEKPEVALRVADAAALGMLELSGEVKAALLSGLSKVNVSKRLLEALGAEFSLAATWLTSLERKESWRYLALRLIQEAVEGRKPWFVSELPPDAEKLLEATTRVLEQAKQCSQLSSTPEILHYLTGGANELNPFREELKIIEGFWKSFGEAGADVKRAMEFYMVSGDPYWLGYASAKVSEEGGSRWAVEQAPSLSSKRQLRWLCSSFSRFLARACREGVAAARDLEEAILLLGSYRVPPQSWHSLALRDHERRERAKACKAVEEAIRVAREVEERVRALRIEAYEYRSELLFGGLYDVVELVELLDTVLSGLCDNARKLGELGEGVLQEMQRE